MLFKVITFNFLLLNSIRMDRAHIRDESTHIQRALASTASTSTQEQPLFTRRLLRANEVVNILKCKYMVNIQKNKDEFVFMCLLCEAVGSVYKMCHMSLKSFEALCTLHKQPAKEVIQIYSRVSAHNVYCAKRYSQKIHHNIQVWKYFLVLFYSRQCHLVTLFI